jgi:hypothetical protein
MSLIIIGSNHVGIATATMTTALPGSPRIGDLVLAFWHVDAGTFSSAASGFTALTSWANNGRWYYKFLKTDADISQTNSWTLTGGTYEQYMEWFVIRGADNSIAPTALFWLIIMIQLQKVTIHHAKDQELCILLVYISIAQVI